MNFYVVAGSKGGIGKTFLGFLTCSYLAKSNLNFIVVEYDKDLGELYKAYSPLGKAVQFNANLDVSLINFNQIILNVKNKDVNSVFLSFPAGFLDRFINNVFPAICTNLGDDKFFLFYVVAPIPNLVDDFDKWCLAISSLSDTKKVIILAYPMWIWEDGNNHNFEQHVKNKIGYVRVYKIPRINRSLVEAFYNLRIPLEHLEKLPNDGAVPLLQMTFGGLSPWIGIKKVIEDTKR